MAAIAALFGVIGTLCGSAITYLGNRALQNQQISQQDATVSRATRAAARLAVFRYDSYETLVTTMLANDAYLEQRLPPPLDTPDESLIIAPMTTGQLDDLALADEGIGYVDAMLKGKRDGGTLQFGDRYILSAIARGDIEKGLGVLKQEATRRLS